MHGASFIPSARWLKPDGMDSSLPVRLSWAEAGLAIRAAFTAMQSPPAEIGSNVEDIDTPALIIDLDAFDRNLAKMTGIAWAANVRLRPHAKTHKSPDIARRQIALGAVGQCVQKVGEAEALAAAGIEDILVSNQVVGDSKLRRLA